MKSEKQPKSFSVLFSPEGESRGKRRPLLRLILLVAVCCLLSFSGGARAAEGEAGPLSIGRGIEPRIVGGFEAQPGAWPWMAALVHADSVDLFQGQFCGGALIDPLWVVTASHCVHDRFGRLIAATELDVVLGVHDLSTDTGERISVKRIVPHPLFNNLTLNNDIALLELNTSSSYPTVALFSAQGATNPTLAGETSTVIGWGNTSYPGSNYPDKLQQVSLPIISNEVCAAAYASQSTTITEKMLCAGYPEGGKDSCQGDSGGPLVVKIGNRWAHAGVVSFGEGCALAGYYGVYGRTSSFETFILYYVPNAKFISVPVVSLPWLLLLQ